MGGGEGVLELEELEELDELDELDRFKERFNRLFEEEGGVAGGVLGVTGEAARFLDGLLGGVLGAFAITTFGSIGCWFSLLDSRIVAIALGINCVEATDGTLFANAELYCL